MKISFDVKGWILNLTVVESFPVWQMIALSMSTQRVNTEDKHIPRESVLSDNVWYYYNSSPKEHIYILKLGLCWNVELEV